MAKIYDGAVLARPGGAAAFDVIITQFGLHSSRTS